MNKSYNDNFHCFPLFILDSFYSKSIMNGCLSFKGYSFSKVNCNEIIKRSHHPIVLTVELGKQFKIILKYIEKRKILACNLANHRTDANYITFCPLQYIIMLEVINQLHRLSKSIRKLDSQQSSEKMHKSCFKISKP